MQSIVVEDRGGGEELVVCIPSMYEVWDGGGREGGRLFCCRLVGDGWTDGRVIS